MLPGGNLYHLLCKLRLISATGLFVPVHLAHAYAKKITGCANNFDW